ncbi:WAT1-related protein At1g09380-like [Telopea speciosissima]|uniref:WAT1-related protein At1g09380-like n=1 Tax=Telopea speciosissima TaxID=54955 RepID=UPI001CC55B20|nr:WAT1-related protein At1g09380-like [Telopea speciosissima]
MSTVTIQILCQIFLSSIFGATLNQCLFILGLKYTTPTIASALSNLLPAITFIIAVPFGLEKVGIKRRSGQANVLGTILCIGGAMLMTFYKGRVINIMKSNIHWRYAKRMQQRSDSSSESNLFLGPLLLFVSCSSWAQWLKRARHLKLLTQAQLYYVLWVALSVESLEYAWSTIFLDGL